MASTKRTAQTDTKQKFDRSLIGEMLEFSGGALYALTVDMKNGKNLMTYSTLSFDWHILYDARYNDTQYHWEKYVGMWKRSQEEKKLSTRLRKVTQKWWDELDAKWKKEAIAQRRSAARAEKKLKIEWEKKEEERKKIIEEENKQREKERIAREKEIERLEKEEQNKLAEAAKKKKTRKTRASKQKPKTVSTKRSGSKTKWRDMKSKMETGAIDQFI